jgi:phosphoribosylglycinamide formyltransferase-1
MYGMHVHEAVISAGDDKSGITIHLVDEQYDHGATLFQADLTIEPGETPESLAARIHALEHKYFPSVIESFVLELDGSGSEQATEAVEQ